MEQQAQVFVGKGRVLGPPKSNAGRRSVAIPNELAKALDDHLARQDSSELPAPIVDLRPAERSRTNRARRPQDTKKAPPEEGAS